MPSLVPALAPLWRTKSRSVLPSASMHLCRCATQKAWPQIEFCSPAVFGHHVRVRVPSRCSIGQPCGFPKFGWHSSMTFCSRLATFRAFGAQVALFPAAVSAPHLYAIAVMKLYVQHAVGAMLTVLLPAPCPQAWLRARLDSEPVELAVVAVPTTWPLMPLLSEPTAMHSAQSSTM